MVPQCNDDRSTDQLRVPGIRGSKPGVHTVSEPTGTRERVLRSPKSDRVTLYSTDMPMTSDIRHLTEFEDDDALAQLQDRTPDDRVDFDLFYNAQRVQPWSEGSNEISRLYFAGERLDGCYIPINFAERLSEDMRSTPLGDPTSNDADEVS